MRGTVLICKLGVSLGFGHSQLWFIPSCDIYSQHSDTGKDWSRPSSGQGNVGTCQESPELLAQWKASNGHCKGLEGEKFSVLAAPPSCWQWSLEPFPQRCQLSSLCNSVLFLSFHQTRDSTPKPHSQIPETSDGYQFQLISIALI